MSIYAKWTEQVSILNWDDASGRNGAKGIFGVPKGGVWLSVLVRYTYVHAVRDLGELRFQIPSTVLGSY